MEVFTKNMGEKEFLFTLLASNAQLVPRILSWKRDHGKYLVNMEQYPSTLIQLPIWKTYHDQVVELLTKLHSMVIFLNKTL